MINSKDVKLDGGDVIFIVVVWILFAFVMALPMEFLLELVFNRDFSYTQSLIAVVFLKYFTER